MIRLNIVSGIVFLSTVFVGLFNWFAPDDVYEQWFYTWDLIRFSTVYSAFVFALWIYSRQEKRAYYAYLWLFTLVPFLWSDVWDEYNGVNYRDWTDYISVLLGVAGSLFQYYKWKKKHSGSDGGKPL